MSAVLRQFDAFEAELCLRVNRWGRAELVRRFFATVSRLGDGYFWLMVGGVCLVLRGGTAVPFLIEAGAAAAVGVLVYKLMKSRLVRERPYVTNGAIRCGAPPLDRYSFPSGHTLHAVCLTVLLAECEPLLLAVTAPFAVLVAISRVVLGLHYPSDVLAGAGIGGALAAVVLST
jgi:undecaprenyl-diphosphatase